VGSGRLDPEAVAEVVRGAAEACRSSAVALVGGETAEMPGLYGEGDFDVVGRASGRASGEVVTGRRVRSGMP
jgi:phosphoribosylformylglycinamidine cyclo-ligase